MAKEVKEKVDERVEVHIPKGYANEEPNFFCAVNGVNYILPRGKKSMVPVHVKEEIDRAFRAQDAWDEKSAQMAEASK